MNSVKRSTALGRPKEQAAGWINDEGGKGNYRRMGQKNEEKEEICSGVVHSGHFNLLLYLAKVANAANS